ncbi:hypothetical protein ABZU25_17380 [Micromonospora sp. NPDC005215]|uniref:ISAzo13-like element transposase-related protein n=1 Tax=Micromonospora sp. NPDC005215 TaxID=3157024 RepID=UPI0033AFC216
MDDLSTDRVEEFVREFRRLEPHLDERQRRLVLAARADSLGRGAVGRIAAAAGVHPSTVSRGIRELRTSDGRAAGRVRRAGGGRKRLTETDPTLLSALLDLMEPHGAARPPLQWTTRSTRALAEELNARRHRASAWTVARLLRESGFRLVGQAESRSSDHGVHHRGFSDVHDRLLACVRDQLPAVVVSGRRPRTGRAKDRPHVGGRGGGGTGSAAACTVRRWWHDARRGTDQLLVVMDTDAAAEASWRQALDRFADDTRTDLSACLLPPNTMRWSGQVALLNPDVQLDWPNSHGIERGVELRVLVAPTAPAGVHPVRRPRRAQR